MKKIIKYLRLILPHLGIALIILAMTLGYFFNWRGKAVLLTTDKTNVFVTPKNELKIVPFALTLNQFNITYYNSGAPKSIVAIIEVETNTALPLPPTFSLTVNHPCKMGFGLDLYLVNYDKTNPENPEWCTVECVYEPLQGLFLSGIILFIMGLLFLVPLASLRLKKFNK